MPNNMISRASGGLRIMQSGVVARINANHYDGDCEHIYSPYLSNTFTELLRETTRN